MAVRRKLEPLQIENAQIIFRNFAGKGSAYNREGDRNFCVVIDDTDYVHFLLENGWNVKSLKPKDEDEAPIYYISVKVNYNSEVAPPKIYRVINGRKTEVGEENVGSLDQDDIQFCDLIINPYFWEVNGKTGIKAYLKTAYIVEQPDRFAAKYSEPSEESEEVPF